MDDYPNHLNPFKRTGLRESFRSLKSAIGGRFRGKRDKAERSSQQPPTSPIGARLRQDGRTNGAVPRSETIIGTTGTPEMLPRSRFNERVTRAKTMDFRSGNHRNPFDDEKKIAGTQIDDGVDGNGTPEVVVVMPAKVQVNGKIDAENGTNTTRHRRRKKRAPLPPGARNTLGVPGEHNSSQWSIDSYTSYETDYSSTTQAHSENEEITAETAERLKDIQEISREIQGLCVDPELDKLESTTKVEELSENKDITEETSVQSKELENVQSSESTKIEQPERMKEEHTLTEEIKEINTVEQQSIEDNSAEDSQAIKDEPENQPEIQEVNDNQSLDEKPPMEEINNNVNSTTTEEHIKTDSFEKTTDITIVKTEDISQSFEKKETEKEEEATDCDTQKEPVPSKETDETQSNNNLSDSRIDIDANSKEVSYVDRRSLFIAGSADNLLDVHQTETSLYITGSCDQLDGTAAPIPKIRKHKLGRDALLGSADDGLNISSDKQ